MLLYTLLFHVLNLITARCICAIYFNREVDLSKQLEKTQVEASGTKERLQRRIVVWSLFLNDRIYFGVFCYNEINRKPNSSLYVCVCIVCLQRKAVIRTGKAI